jgi:predicted ester cyclase
MEVHMDVERNRAVVRRYFEEFHSQRRAEILPDILAPSLHEPTREATERLISAFPDYRITIEVQVAEEDRVATVWSATGTHGGEWSSPIGPVAPTGRQISWTGTTTLRLTDGKIADILGSNWDHLGILQQMNAAPESTPRPGA